MKTSYDKMTNADFDRILEGLVSKMSAGQILSYDEVRATLGEELNNEVLEQWEQENPELAQDWSDEQTAINRLNREDIAAILEANGIQCYDNESKECLATALFENVKDGTIAFDEVMTQ